MPGGVVVGGAVVDGVVADELPPAAVPLSAVMTRDVICCSPHDDLDEVGLPWPERGEVGPERTEQPAVDAGTVAESEQVDPDLPFLEVTGVGLGRLAVPPDGR